VFKKGKPMKEHNMKYLLLAFADWNADRHDDERQQSAHFVCCHLEDLGFNPAEIVSETLINDAEKFLNEPRQ